MTAIVSGIDYNVLFGGSGSTLGASATILNALYSGNANGGTPATTFVSTGNPITDLKLAQSQKTRDIAEEAKQPQVQSTIALFKKAVASAKTIKDALANPYVQQVLLTANGLSNYIGQTALVQKAFLSDPSDSKSLVSKLDNATLTAAVDTYKFGSKGLKPLQDPSVIASLSSGYAEVQWRRGLDQVTPGLSSALDFQTGASSIKKINDILGNPSYFDVITTALGIPPQIVNQDVAAVNRAINSKLNIADLQKPNFVNSLTDQYLLTRQQANQTATGSTTDPTSLAIKVVSLTA